MFFILDISGHLLKHKWENAMTIDKKSWGFRREAPLSDYLTVHDLLTLLAETVRFELGGTWKGVSLYSGQGWFRNLADYLSVHDLICSQKSGWCH